VRVLFVTLPPLAAVFPIVPLAWALRAAGHEVLVGTNSSALRACAGAGLPAFDVAPGDDLLETFRVGMWAEPAGPPDVPPAELVERVGERMGRLLAVLIDRSADRAVEVAGTWCPDLVVFSTMQGVGPLVATLLRVPSVEQSIGLTRGDLKMGTTSLSDRMLEATRRAARRHGLPGLPDPPMAVLDMCPPSMAEEDRPAARCVRYVPYNGGGALPSWLLESPARTRPRICVTLGTELPELIGLTGLAGVLEAAAELDVEVVLAVGDADLSALGPLPANVVTPGWVPLSALLPTCAAIVHHGGATTTMNALAAGLPQLVLPRAGDQLMNAAAIARRGVGKACPLDGATAKSVRGFLPRLLEDHGLRDAAAEVQREIAATPPPAEMVRGLVPLDREANVSTSRGNVR
jgi:UDP:flavonoid glycosyltransferase YjiC (YdhE family)